MDAVTVQDYKRVSISSKRQITIPQIFFTALGFENEAECILRDDEIVIRPCRIDNSSEFAEEILADLLKEGYEGKALLKEFKIRKAKVRPAVKRVIKEAKAAARGKAKSYSFEEVFGEDK